MIFLARDCTAGRSVRSICFRFIDRKYSMMKYP